MTDRPVATRSTRSGPLELCPDRRQPLRPGQVVEVGIPGTRAPETWHQDQTARGRRRGPRMGQAGVALGVPVVVGADHQLRARVGLSQDLGDGLEVARMEGHRHGRAGGLVDGGAGGVALAQIESSGGLADQVEVSAQAGAGVEPLGPVRADGLDAVQRAGRIRDRDQEPVAAAPDAVGLDALFLEVGMSIDLGGRTRTRVPGPVAPPLPAAPCPLPAGVGRSARSGVECPPPPPGRSSPVPSPSSCRPRAASTRPR